MHTKMLQYNNLKIFLVSDYPVKYTVEKLDKTVLEEFRYLADAITFCKHTQDFIVWKEPIKQ